MLRSSEGDSRPRSRRLHPVANVQHDMRSRSSRESGGGSQGTDSDAMSTEDYLPPTVVYSVDMAHTVVEASVQNFTDARSYHATIGVDPAVAMDLSQGMARAAAQSQVPAAEVEATRAQAAQSQENLMATAQATHEGILNDL